jgi:predicted RNase H-like nuclease (RuvC/YqgF family)
MAEENTQRPSVSEMLRMTGTNTEKFMAQVAEHVEKLEIEIKRLAARVQEMENQNDDFK